MCYPSDFFWTTRFDGLVARMGHSPSILTAGRMRPSFSHQKDVFDNLALLYSLLFLIRILCNLTVFLKLLLTCLYVPFSPFHQFASFSIINHF